MMRLAKLTGFGLLLTGLAACGGGGGGITGNFSTEAPTPEEGTPVGLGLENLSAAGARLIERDVELRNDQRNILPIEGSAIYQGVAAFQLDSNFGREAGDQEDNVVLDADYIGRARAEANFERSQSESGVSGRGVEITADNFVDASGNTVAGAVRIDGARMNGGRGVTGDLAGELAIDGTLQTLTGAAVGQFQNSGDGLSQDPEILRIGVTNGLAGSTRIRSVFIAQKTN